MSGLIGPTLMSRSIQLTHSACLRRVEEKLGEAKTGQKRAPEL